MICDSHFVAGSLISVSGLENLKQLELLSGWFAANQSNYSSCSPADLISCTFVARLIFHQQLCSQQIHSAIHLSLLLRPIFQAMTFTRLSSRNCIELYGVQCVLHILPILFPIFQESTWRYKLSYPSLCNVLKPFSLEPNASVQYNVVLYWNKCSQDKTLAPSY
jgi:hypothetical protein